MEQMQLQAQATITPTAAAAGPTQQNVMNNIATQ
jgi:hypothetical protein